MLRPVLERVLNGDFAGRDLANGTTFEKSLLESEIGFGQGDEQTIVQLQKIGHDLAQNHVLLNALDGRFLICDAVATPGMQQAMIARGRAEGHFSALDDSHT